MFINTIKAATKARKNATGRANMPRESHIVDFRWLLRNHFFKWQTDDLLYWFFMLANLILIHSTDDMMMIENKEDNGDDADDLYLLFDYAV